MLGYLRFVFVCLKQTQNKKIQILVRRLLDGNRLLLRFELIRGVVFDDVTFQRVHLTQDKFDVV